jgi:hypothetical protein
LCVTVGLPSVVVVAVLGLIVGGYAWVKTHPFMVENGARELLKLTATPGPFDTP